MVVAPVAYRHDCWLELLLHLKYSSTYSMSYRKTIVKRAANVARVYGVVRSRMIYEMQDRI